MTAPLTILHIIKEWYDAPTCWRNAMRGGDSS